MSCITQSDMDKLEQQVLQYQIVYDSVKAEYQAEYDKRIPYMRMTGDTIGEKRVLLRLQPLSLKLEEAKRQRDQFKKMGICEDIEKKKQQQAQTVAIERIKELEEKIKLSEEQLILSEKEFSTVKAKQTLTNQYIIAIAGIVLIGILLFRRRA